MAIVLFDSNILIDHTLGIQEATMELAGYDDAAISVIGWMEASSRLMPQQLAAFEQDLSDAGIVILHTTRDIMHRTIQLRAQTGKKLPDCIIRATAEVHGRLIVTRNPDDFGGVANPRVRVPYKIANGIVYDVLPLPP